MHPRQFVHNYDLDYDLSSPTKRDLEYIKVLFRSDKEKAINEVLKILKEKIAPRNECVKLLQNNLSIEEFNRLELSSTIQNDNTDILRESLTRPRHRKTKFKRGLFGNDAVRDINSKINDDDFEESTPQRSHPLPAIRGLANVRSPILESTQNIDIPETPAYEMQRPVVQRSINNHSDSDSTSNSSHSVFSHSSQRMSLPSDIMSTPMRQPKKDMDKIFTDTPKPTGSRSFGSMNVGDKVKLLNKNYSVVDLIGSGGSSQVFKVISEEGEIFALKRVQLTNIDPKLSQAYFNEVQILDSLKDFNSHVIKMIGYEIFCDCILIIEEAGEIDLKNLLKSEKKNQVLDLVKIKYFWQQMLHAVSVIHDHRIVHGDLKPANFLLVQGRLKIIDFGIAKRIANETANISRDNLAGTLNYISPEAITSDYESGSKIKIGRPADVWSLGCILYQMIYGKSPFSHIKNILLKLQAIPNPNCEIAYGNIQNELLLDVLQGCLCRDPDKRLTIPELLKHPFLTATLLDNQLGPNLCVVSKDILNQIVVCVRNNPDVSQNDLVESFFSQLKDHFC
eukprot:TRINITY_DN2715_c0_g1_i1.p1 TRINITY_DN2715_c0_g1~~TRINITY_DN2715_c0_g1_i1.p1  ORF type:complete len:584 (+),score=126.93 TRINITY_DN2715_c0_g1_i1:61-1752(+)